MVLRVPFYFFNLITRFETKEIMRSAITFCYDMQITVFWVEKSHVLFKMVCDLAGISALLCYYRHQKLHQYQMVGNGTRVCNTACSRSELVLFSKNM